MTGKFPSMGWDLSLVLKLTYKALLQMGAIRDVGSLFRTLTAASMLIL